MTINAYFGWDFNSCEMILKDGVWYPFDFANPCPDSQVTSLHVHFPWGRAFAASLALFCAATKRPMRCNLDWDPFNEIAAQDIPYRQMWRPMPKLPAIVWILRGFEEFCSDHLANLDEVAKSFFATDCAKDAVNQKVKALFPEHEWDEFTELFWGKIQEWREAPV